MAWERWDLPRTIFFLCGVTTSILCGNALCTIDGDRIWTVTLAFQVGGQSGFLAASSIFWQIVQYLTADRLQVIRRILIALSAHRRRKDVFQTVFLSCMGSGAVASLTTSAFMTDFGRTYADQFCQACAQSIAVFVLVNFALFTLRNLVFFNIYRLSIMFRRSYIRSRIKPIQMNVPDLSKEAPGECSVCLRCLADDDGEGLLRLSCNHTFHVSCITYWLSTRSACPMCRATVPTLRSCVHIKQKEVSPVSPAKSHASTAGPADSSEPIDVESELVERESAPSSPGVDFTSLVDRESAPSFPGPSHACAESPNDIRELPATEVEEGGQQWSIADSPAPAIPEVVPVSERTWIEAREIDFDLQLSDVLVQAVRDSAPSRLLVRL
mmetsp:Transcript_4253/g.7552  ORF Transcript_4253/g.7552 Transcript_4253/m.7552 type:complete len:383 (+) Transcript_4253:2-1150(+)